MLWRFELKKTLINQKGVWILLVCLLLKLVVLNVFPEQKDSRIRLSQKQYDKYLVQLQGENTPEKSQWILTEYAHFKSVIGQSSQMREAYTAGEISDEEWENYNKAYTEAELKLNSATIFAEKAEQFTAQPEDLPPAHYIYEYGWESVFTLQKFPDIFLLFGILLLTAQSFPAETQSGMLPVLLAARNGRKQLYRAKLGMLLAVCAVGCAVFAGAEWAMFANRGWMNDGNVPLYSITIFAECPLDMTLTQGYVQCLWVRLLTAIAFTVLMFGLSVYLRSITESLFAGLCLLALPMLWDGAVMLFTHSGLLRGTKMLLWLGESGKQLWLPLTVVGVCSILVAVLGEKKQERGI